MRGGRLFPAVGSSQAYNNNNIKVSKSITHINKVLLIPFKGHKAKNVNLRF